MPHLKQDLVLNWKILKIGFHLFEIKQGFFGEAYQYKYINE